MLDNVKRFGIHATHSAMCKFENASVAGYKLVAAAIMRYVKQAPVTIGARWVNERELLFNALVK